MDRGLVFLIFRLFQYEAGNELEVDNYGPAFEKILASTENRHTHSANENEKTQEEVGISKGSENGMATAINSSICRAAKNSIME